MLYVAFSFLNGLDGFPKSQFHAYHYYKKAAEIDPYIYCMLGNLFRIGISFSRNMHKAAKFYALSNLHGCLRGRFYDGFMQIRNYFPSTSTKKQLKYLDKYFFDYKNQQGKLNPFNYCKEIQAAQQHFPIMIDYYIDAKSISRERRHPSEVDQRRKNDSAYIKQSIYAATDVSNAEDDDEKMLDDTEIHISLWFTLYQLKIMIDNGLLLKGQQPIVSLFKDPNYYFAITDSSTLYDDDKTIQHVLYKTFKKSIPERIKYDIKEQVKKNTVEQTLAYFEENLVSKRVDKDEFESFIRR